MACSKTVGHGGRLGVAGALPLDGRLAGEALLELLELALEDVSISLRSRLPSASAAR